MLEKLKTFNLDIDMINEKMNELLILRSLLSTIDTNDIEHNGETRMIKGPNGKYYNINKMKERAETLVEEFTEQYAI